MPLGLPHSEFLGWLQSDQDKALAYMRENAKVCPRCHTRHEEWEADENAYLGDIDTCEGCARLDQEEDNIKNGKRPGQFVRLLPYEVAIARMDAGKGVG